MSRTHRFLIAGVAFGAAASAAQAGLSELYVEANVFNSSSIVYAGESQSDADSDSFGRYFPKGSDFASDWAGKANALVSLDGQDAYSKSVIVLNTDSTGFAYTSTVDFGADVGSSGIVSASDAFHNFNAQMIFDADTEVEVLFRVDFERSDTLYHYGEIEISGLENAATERLVVAGGSSDGYVSVGYRAIAPEGAFVSLQARIEGGAYASFGDPEQYSGAFTVTAIVRVVPAPSGAGLLAALGLTATRRRRNQAV